MEKQFVKTNCSKTSFEDKVVTIENLSK